MGTRKSSHSRIAGPGLNCGRATLLGPLDEILCARRMENARRAQLAALAASPRAVETLLNAYRETLQGRRRLSEIIEGIHIGRARLTPRGKLSDPVFAAVIAEAMARLRTEMELQVPGKRRKPIDRHRHLASHLSRLRLTSLWQEKLIGILRGQSDGIVGSQLPWPVINARLSCAQQLHDTARHCLVNANLRLVIAIARRFRDAGLDRADLVQEGNIGLIRAADRFDYRRDVRFAAYAGEWIYHAMLHAVEHCRDCVHLSQYDRQRARDVRRAADALQLSLGRAPAAGEITASLNLPVTRLRNEWLELPRMFSLDQPASRHDTTITDRLNDPSSPDPLRQLADDELKRHIDRLLEILPDRQRMVLNLRFGIHADTAHTLEAIGRHLGITRERVRQIESSALQRLRAQPGTVELRSLLENATPITESISGGEPCAIYP